MEYGWWLGLGNTYGNTLMNKQSEIIKYKVFTLRLHEETKKKLIKKQKESGKSWNLFMLDLLELHK